MALSNVDTTLASIQALLEIPSGSHQVPIKRSGWYRLRIDTVSAGSAVINMLVKSDTVGVYGYAIVPEELGVISGEHYNSVTDTADAVFFVKSSTGQITSDAANTIALKLHHYLHLEKGDVLLMDSIFQLQIDYVGPYCPKTICST